MAEIIGRLENWVYYPGSHMICGNIYNDVKNRFDDGVYIHTSELRISKKAALELKAGDVVITRNSKYLLGDTI